ncbi:MAG: tetratricopeptide repeat protein [Armatimonadota bacterium]|nr:tetratricopeptide repeat protein [Armatimonadota bacterium]
MMRFFLTFCAAAAAFSAFAKIDITSSVKNGDKIAGTVEIRVTVTADATVNSVEFYVNGDLRSTDTSTPYLYSLDTLPEKEGPLKLTIGAYSSAGESKKVDLNLTVDNGVSQGVKFHVDNAVRFLQVSKWNEALQAARVALKADENSVDAKVAMARAYMGKQEFDKAQQWAEDALITKETVQVHELLAVINADRAFSIISRSGDRGDALKNIVTAMKAAVVQKKASVDMQIKEAGPVTDANRLKVVDLLMQKHDYSAARRYLLEKFSEGTPDLHIGNRLIYATFRSGRIDETFRLMELMRKKEVMNSTTYALDAALRAYYRHWDLAEAAIKDGGFDDADDPALISSAAYVALMQGDKAAAGSQVRRMIDKNINDSAALYFTQTLMFFTGQYSAAREYFHKTIVKDPLTFESFIERGYEALAIVQNPPAGFEKDKPIILEQALSFFQLAQDVKPDAAAALNGIALAKLYQGKGTEALSMAKAAVAAGPEFPWAHYTLAAAYDATGDYRTAIKEVDEGGRLDPHVLRGRNVPSIAQAYDYTYRYARMPLLVMPKS